MNQVAKVQDNIDIWFETFGEKKDPAILLIMGGCCQGVLWPKEFCEKLVREGFFVIRYDHRDSGLSTCFDYQKNPYSLMDMAKDAIGVLDSAGVYKAHLFGVSMGGFIAEVLAAYFPERVNTILLLGSTCEIRPMNLGYAGLPVESAEFSPPTAEYLQWMKGFVKLTPITYEDKLAQRIEGWHKLNGRKRPLDEYANREMQQEFLSRLRNPQSVVNHITMLADVNSENLIRILPSKISLPTVILQGSEDPIFPTDHGVALSREIKHSEYILVDGMGHIPSRHFYDLYIEVLKRQLLIIDDIIIHKTNKWVL